VSIFYVTTLLFVSCLIVLAGLQLISSCSWLADASPVSVRVLLFRMHTTVDDSVRNTSSPTYIRTVPLKYEYGTELFFYVRIIQAESEHATNKRHSISRGCSNSDDGTVISAALSSPADSSTYLEESDPYGSASPHKKNRGGYCFGTALFEVGDLLASRNYTKVKRLKKGGCVYARIEPMDQGDENERLRFRFQFQAQELTVKRSKVGQRLHLTKELDTVLEIARPHESPTLHSWCAPSCMLRYGCSFVLNFVPNLLRSLLLPGSPYSVPVPFTTATALAGIFRSSIWTRFVDMMIW